VPFLLLVASLLTKQEVVTVYQIFLQGRPSTPHGCCLRTMRKGWRSWKSFRTLTWMSGLRREERETLAAEPDRRLHRREFDRSRIGDEQQRENLARRYVEMTDKLRQLGTHFRLLEIAKTLSGEWQDKT
jgi:hypothetical protein